VFGIEERLSHGEVRAGFDFGVEASNLFIEIVGNGLTATPMVKLVAPPRVLPDQSVP